MKAIDIIESAKSYWLLANDHISEPVLVGGRIKLEFALQSIDSDMVIATSGDNKGKKCVILMDLSADEVWALTQKADMKVMRIKAKN